MIRDGRKSLGRGDLHVIGVQVYDFFTLYTGPVCGSTPIHITDCHICKTELWIMIQAEEECMTGAHGLPSRYGGHRCRIRASFICQNGGKPVYKIFSSAMHFQNEEESIYLYR
jgi:hypothetical protein